MLPPHIIRDILERERAREQPVRERARVELPLPEIDRSAPAEEEAPRGIVEIDLFG
ncbi:MAG TPA: hypothetical protein RMH85_23610 [Polyangiaceae bacterium LLY-WYZ-15_(1-7)]|nr:hypothetical protein [Polyangiaceae bacterium LLY-WYZ-15_(1-7)]HJL11483.1 hypothetical protein [Polyangiaceae bacterium LLY-WYZ-15_(1-7)]HJL45165.1 hypothetical protein [Polyangiaceae bacterium LLY-WYZ-15_(1-7)]